MCPRTAGRRPRVLRGEKVRRASRTPGGCVRRGGRAEVLPNYPPPLDAENGGSQGPRECGEVLVAQLSLLLQEESGCGLQRNGANTQPRAPATRPRDADGRARVPRVAASRRAIQAGEPRFRGCCAGLPGLPGAAGEGVDGIRRVRARAAPPEFLRLWRASGGHDASQRSPHVPQAGARDKSARATQPRTSVADGSAAVAAGVCPLPSPP